MYFLYTFPEAECEGTFINVPPAGSFFPGNLAVIASPYMVSDILLHNQNGLQVFNLNRAFLLNLLEMMEGDTDLAEARSRQPTLSTLNVESKFFQKLVSWILSFAFPVFFVFLGHFI